MWRSWLHRLLGGRTDDEGRPVLGDNDWVEVFDGQGPDVDHVRQALADDEIETSAHVYVPLGAAYGRTADPRTGRYVPAFDVRSHARNASRRDGTERHEVREVRDSQACANMPPELAVRHRTTLPGPRASAPARTSPPRAPNRTGDLRPRLPNGRNRTFLQSVILAEQTVVTTPARP